jgi:hypothetical protein
MSMEIEAEMIEDEKVIEEKTEETLDSESGPD